MWISVVSVDEEVPGFCFWPAVVKEGPAEKRCVQLWQRIGADMMGNISPCCGIDEPLLGPESNLFRADPDTLVNHPVLVSMRAQLLDPFKPPPDPCKACNLLGEPGW